jgi:hypothetical protein
MQVASDELLVRSDGVGSLHVSIYRLGYALDH